MTDKPLFTESTDVPVAKSIGEITRLLIDSGARNISSDYDAGRVTGFSFVLQIGSNQIPYKLPVRVEPVLKIFSDRRKKTRHYPTDWQGRDRDQAERVAWRQLFWWLKANLALIQLNMVSPAEVMWPYMLGPDGRTFYEVHGPKLLEAPKAETGGSQ